MGEEGKLNLQGGFRIETFISENVLYMTNVYTPPKMKVFSGHHRAPSVSILWYRTLLVKTLASWFRPLYVLVKAVGKNKYTERLFKTYTYRNALFLHT